MSTDLSGLKNDLGSVIVEHSPAAMIDDDLQWVAVSIEHPCPICAAIDGCGVALCPECTAVNCLRIVSDFPMTDGGWLHRLSAVDVQSAR